MQLPFAQISCLEMIFVLLDKASPLEDCLFPGVGAKSVSRSNYLPDS
jgi:hypothetical protein